MATYQANITKNIEPAMADPSSYIRGMQAQGQAVTTLIKGGEEMYKGYVEQEVANVTEDITQQAETYFTRSRAQTELNALQQMQPAKGSIFAENMLGAGGEEARQEATTELQSFDAKIAQLTEAAKGGMSPDVFQANVQATIRKAINRFPGLANDIRQNAARITGIDLSTQGFVSRYIQEQFSPKKGTGKDVVMEAVEKDITDAANKGYATREKLWAMKNSGDPEYDVIMKNVKESQVLSTQAQLLADNLKNTEGRFDVDARKVRGNFNAIFDTTLGASVINMQALDTDKTLASMANLMLKGDPMAEDPVKFKVLVDAHNAKMNGVINDAKIKTLASLDAYFATREVSQNLRDSMRKDVIDKAALMSSKYADQNGNGVTAMAQIFKNYRDLTFTEQRAKVDLALRQISAFNNPALVANFYTKGPARERIKLEQPDFFAIMESLDNDLGQGLTGARDAIESATDLANIRTTLTRGQTTGKAVPVDPLMTPQLTRAAHQIMYANAREVLKKNEFSAEDVGIISSALTTGTQYGANAVLVQKDFKRLGEQIAKMPETDQAVIKGNVSESAQGTIISLNALKKGMEEKYGTTLTLGVNDAGEVSVVPQVLPAQLKPRGISEMSAALNSPAMAERKKQSEAASEFMMQAKPLLSNLVFSTAMLTQKQPKEVGTEFATVINNNQPYGGFYNNQAQPVATPQQPAATPTTPAAPATKLAPAEESKFQSWIKSTEWYKEFVKEYKEEPDLNITEYDYRAAWKAGVKPERDPYDNNRYHWPSSMPDGQMLKSKDHPTAWKEEYMRETGKNPDAVGVTKEQYEKSKQKKSSTTPELGTPEFDALVRASIENMRAREPSINVDYMFRAFKNASPATQKQLAEKYKAGNITMADINTK